MENTEKKHKLERKNSQHLKKPCLRRDLQYFIGLISQDSIRLQDSIFHQIQIQVVGS